MKARDARKIRDGIFIIGFLVILATGIYEPLLYIGAAVMFCGLIPDFLYNKCPHCGKHLGRSEGDYCQHCGGKLD